MPMEYGVMLIILAGMLTGLLYALYLSRHSKNDSGDRPDSRFEDDVLKQLRRARETGESIVLRERGWPTVEIHPEKYSDPHGNLKGSVLRYNRPTDPIGD